MLLKLLQPLFSHSVNLVLLFSCQFLSPLLQHLSLYVLNKLLVNIYLHNLIEMFIHFLVIIRLSLLRLLLHRFLRLDLLLNLLFCLLFLLIFVRDRLFRLFLWLLTILLLLRLLFSLWRHCELYFDSSFYLLF